MSALLWVGVAIAGGAGGVLRFLVDGVVSARVGRSFPFGTLVVNVTGAALLGFLAGVVLDDDWALLAGTAAVGSYTTFSTWMLESHRLAERRAGGAVALNLVVPLLCGITAAALGRAVGAAL